MVELVVVLGLAGVGVYATLKGTFGAVAEAYAKSKEAAVKAELAKLKVDVSAELAKVETSVSTEVKTLVADIKKYL